MLMIAEEIVNKNLPPIGLCIRISIRLQIGSCAYPPL